MSPPQDQHVACARDPLCLDLARETSTHPKFIPTSVVHYFRPDRLGFMDHFPWLEAPDPKDAPARLIGVEGYIAADRMTSITVSMPLLLLLSLVGTAAAGWERRWLILASCATPLVTCMYFGATQRYLADFVPALALASACGVASVKTLRWRPGVIIVLAALGIWSVSVSLALAVWSWYTFGTA